MEIEEIQNIKEKEDKSKSIKKIYILISEIMLSTIVLSLLMKIFFKIYNLFKLIFLKFIQI